MVLGIGLAMTFVPLTTITLATIAREEMGNATGMYNLMRNMGGKALPYSLSRQFLGETNVTAAQAIERRIRKVLEEYAGACEPGL